MTLHPCLLKGVLVGITGILQPSSLSAWSLESVDANSLYRKLLKLYTFVWGKKKVKKKEREAYRVWWGCAHVWKRQQQDQATAAHQPGELSSFPGHAAVWAHFSSKLLCNLNTSQQLVKKDGLNCQILAFLKAVPTTSNLWPQKLCPGAALLAAVSVPQRSSCESLQLQGCRLHQVVSCSLGACASSVCCLTAVRFTLPFQKNI